MAPQIPSEDGGKKMDAQKIMDVLASLYSAEYGVDIQITVISEDVA